MMCVLPVSLFFGETTTRLFSEIGRTLKTSPVTWLSSRTSSLAFDELRKIATDFFRETKNS